MIDFYSHDLLYLLFFVLSVIFSILINGILLRFAKTLGIRQPENMIRWATTTKPAIGGISFYILFLISISAYSIFQLSKQNEFNLPLIGLILSSSFGFLLGLADDAYNTIPTLKFAGQLVCAILLISTGIMINLTGYFIIDASFTAFWVIGIMNSINMLDNMDGISSSIALSILLAGLAVMAVQQNFFTVQSFQMIGVCGALIGFLFYNFNPSRMYMGDTGSQFLGVFLAGISIMLFWDQRQPNIPGIQIKQFILPLLSFTVPIMDTATVFIHRIRRKHSPFVGGRDHTTHHLVYHGFTDRHVFFILFSLSLLMNGITVLIYKNFESVTSMHALAIFGLYLLLFILIQMMYLTAKPPHVLSDNNKQ